VALLRPLQQRTIFMRLQRKQIYDCLHQHTLSMARGDSDGYWDERAHLGRINVLARRPSFGHTLPARKMASIRSGLRLR
jgi:hypothetical protein